jgi:hypothetical protein
MMWAGHVARFGEEEKSVQGFDRKARRKETTRKTEAWWEDIRMDLRDSDWVGVEWIQLAQDRTGGGLL